MNKWMCLITNILFIFWTKKGTYHHPSYHFVHLVETCLLCMPNTRSFWWLHHKNYCREHSQWMYVPTSWYWTYQQISKHVIRWKLTELKCKVPICTVEEMECVGLMNKKKSDCYQNCEGLYVTSFIKSDTDERGSSFLRGISADYDLYKGIIKFPINLKSN